MSPPRGQPLGLMFRASFALLFRAARRSDKMNSTKEESPPPPPAALRRLGAFVAAGVIGSLTALVGVAIYWTRNTTGRLPPLTGKELDQARKLWRVAGPANYDVEIVVTGRQPAVYAVQVRDGQAITAMRNGKPLRQKRTFGTWSVPGMFSTIGADVDNQERVASGTADVQTPQVSLRGLFHPRLGYPLKYVRLERVRFGNNRTVTWEIRRFTQKPPTGGDAAPEAPSAASTDPPAADAGTAGSKE